MRKIILTAIVLLSFTALFAQGFDAKRGCRRWTIKIFGYTLVEHSNDACGNSDGNWDWGGNGTYTP